MLITWNGWPVEMWDEGEVAPHWTIEEEQSEERQANILEVLSGKSE